MTPDAAPSAPAASSFYPYLANASQYPSPDPLGVANLTGPAVLASKAGCGGPTAIPLYYANTGYYVGGSLGSLPPDGCQLYSVTVSESLWNQTSGQYLTATEIDEAIAGSAPAFSIYGDINAAAGPTTFAAGASGPNASIHANLASWTAAENVWGGWGTYEFAIVAGGSSYGSYCFEIGAGYPSTPPFCGSLTNGNDLGVGIAVTAATQPLGVNFTSRVYIGCPAYSYAWSFGDGGTSVAADPVHTYAAGGAYAVTLTVHDCSGGMVATDSLAIDVPSNGGAAAMAFPRLASTVIQGVPTFVLLEAATETDGPSSLLFLTGTYSASEAKAIYNGTATESLPIIWSGPEVVASFAQPITGDALTSAPDGSTLAAAVSSGGLTWVFRSWNGGVGWVGLTPSALPGSDPNLALGNPGFLVTTLGSGDVYATTLSTQGYGAPEVELGPGSAASPVWAAGTASGSLGVGIVDAGSVLYYRSTDNGYSFSRSGGTAIGTYGTSGSSPIFNSVGATRLADPQAVAGTITAVADSANVFVLYTSEVGGRVVANVTTSPDGGVTWNPSLSYQLPVGSLGEPQAVVSPAGYVYVTWTDDSLGTSAVDQAVFLPDGRVIQHAQPLPGTGGRLDSPASQPAVAVDPFMRPLYVWLSTPPSSAPVLQVSGAFLKPLDATNLTNAAFEQLTAWDFSPSSSTHQTTQSATTSSFESNVTKLEAALRDPSPNLCYPSDAQNATALLYHGDTAFPLTYDPTPSSACANLAPAETPASNVSSAGVLAPSTYLSVLTDWIFEGEGVQVDYRGDALAAALGLGINPNPAATGLPPVPGPATTYSHSSTVLGQSATATVTLWPWNPTTGSIHSAVSFPQLYVVNSHSVVCGVVGFHPIYETWYNESETVGFSWSVTTEGHTQSYSSSVSPEGLWNLPAEVYLTNLTPNAGISWSTGNFYATYDRFYHYYDACTGTNWAKDTGYAATGTIPGFSGTLYTSLAMHPGAPGNTFIRATPDGSSHENLTYLWNNTMPASASISLSGSSPWSTNQWSIPEAHQFTNVPTGINYTTSIDVQSQVGAWNSTQEPGVSAGEDTYANPLGNNFGCTFPLENNPVQIDGRPWVVTDPSANKATVIWNSTADGPSWLQYYELGVGLNWSQTAMANSTGPSGYPYQYSVELQGIPPFALFGLTAWTSYVADPGCISYANTSSTVFLTPGGFSLTEWDHPYDSITGQGGGASIEWNVAPGFVSNGQLLGGALFYKNDTSTPTTVVAPIVSSVGLTQYGTTYVYNVSLAQLNTTYTAWVELNYSVHWGTIDATFTIVSSPHTFVYQQDTSGDGLTNLEKVLGWTVTTTGLSGQTTNQWVSANPSDWATNGLVNDYVEKQFGLNPNTLDTAGSHMLDTWNLTFQLPSSTCPADVQCWYENGSNPFSFKVTPTGPNPGGKPVATNSTSVAHWTSGGLQDDAPYDAEVTWAGGSLGVLQSLIVAEHVGWLRGVIMHGYNKEWTLTVWGKLSWGANPLAQSTTGDGLVDGAQPNPVSREALQVKITSWAANLKSGNDEAAPFLEVTGTGAYGTTVFYGGYGPAKKGSSVSFSGAYVISAPIVSSSQFASFNVTIVDNASTSGSDLYYPLQFGPVSVDLLGSTGTHSLSRTQSNASLKVTYELLRVGEAANTLLWAPANNTTLSNLPWGLKRYTAEPDFDLIVLNLTSAVTLTGIGGAEGGWSYSVHLDAGLNNLLVPRGAFLASPLGQALVNNTNRSVPIPSGAGVTFHPTDWSGRTETSNSNAPGNPNYIWVFSTLSQSQNGSSSTAFGGLPQNPAVESGYQSRQVQAVFWVSATGSGYGGLTSAGAELKDLFGGLVLNASGNRTGNILSVTAELGTLGLPANVRVAMANVTLQNDGSYAAPEYQQPPPSPSFWQSVGDAVWNTLSGIANDVTALVSVVWNAVQAAAAYVGEAASWLSSHLGLSKLASQFVSGLKTLASAMEWAFLQALDFIVTEVTNLFDSAAAPIKQENDAYYRGINSTLSPIVASVGQGHSVTQAQASGFWTSIAGTEYLIVGGLATAVEIAIWIVSILSVGFGSLIGILLKVAIGGASGALSQSVSSLLGVGGFTRQFVSGSWAVVNATGAALHLQATAWVTFLQLVEYLTGIEAVGAGFIAAFSAAAYGFPPGVATVFSIVWSILSLMAWIHVHTVDQGDEPLLVYSALVGIGAVVLGIRGAQTSRVWPETWAGLVGAGIGSVSVGLDVGEAVLG